MARRQQAHQVQQCKPTCSYSVYLCTALFALDICKRGGAIGFKNAPSDFNFFCIIEISFTIEVCVLQVKSVVYPYPPSSIALILFCIVPTTVKLTLLIGYYYSQSCFVINMMLIVCITTIPEGQGCCSSYNEYGIVNN